MENIKKLVVKLLNYAVRQYLRRSRVKIIVVAGSIGKTSTTSAIRTVLSQRYKVHQPKTAYNTNKSVHLELFDMGFASSLPGWIWATATMLVRSLGTAGYEVAVIEIGTDCPGEMRSFAWLQPDMGVLTAVAPEHMENFKTIEAVAKEEFSIIGYCKRLVINRNSVATELVPANLPKHAIWYGRGEQYSASKYNITNNQVRANFVFGTYGLTDVPLKVLGEHSLEALTAAGAVGILYGLSRNEIDRGLQAVEPVKGRMKRLNGRDGIIIIDDTYNASPVACKAALDVLYAFDAPQRIALLGTMNEMGEYSKQAHREVGEYCDPSKLDLVVTIGTAANTFLAPSALKQGCTVKTFMSPYAAGVYLYEQLKPNAVLLAKGSQNGVFAEEALKPLLDDNTEVDELVRQSNYWMNCKRKQFDL